MQTSFQIKKSTIPNAGKGLFAKKSLPKGAELRVLGTLIKRNSIADHCTRYADAYKFRVGIYLLIPMGWEGMINHSETPNMVKVIKGTALSLRTLRPIHSGEELFHCYSRYAQNRFYKNR